MWRRLNCLRYATRYTSGNPQRRTESRQQGEISCVIGGSDNVYLATHEGMVHTLSKSFKVTNSFKAHEHGSITHLKQPDGTSLLVTIAEDLSNEPTLKVWALDKVDKKSGVPRCLSTITIQNARRTFPVCEIMIISGSPLTVPDICICCCGRSIATSLWLCKWSGHSSKGRSRS